MYAVGGDKLLLATPLSGPLLQVLTFATTAG